MQQNVKTRFSARCVRSRAANDGGHGTVVVTGLDVDEELLVSFGGGLGFVVLLGFAPPSWFFVGMVDVLVDKLSGGVTCSVDALSPTLRFRFCGTLFDVAEFILFLVRFTVQDDGRFQTAGISQR